MPPVSSFQLYSSKLGKSTFFRDDSEQKYLLDIEKHLDFPPKLGKVEKKKSRKSTLAVLSGIVPAPCRQLITT